MSASSIQTKSVVIANGAVLSSACECGFARLARISMPAAFTGTAMGVHVLSDDGVTYRVLYNSDGSAYGITCAAGREIIVNLVDFLGIQSFKLLSNAAEGAERTIGITLVA